MTFIIKIEPEAKLDIQEGIDWYNEKEAGLGRTFHSAVKAHLKKLTTNPFFQIRYDKARCLPLKKFPYLIHFTIDEKNTRVIVHAILNTAREPKIWKDRK
jgi:hypothetical protein|tara:strand:- start:176 stop:475 length:300 start_codon:yes stop_codon:yes gene_type:complete